MRLIDADELRIKPEYMHDICGSAMIRVQDVARIINELPTIDPRRKWIPVSERLPDPDKKQDVLVTLDYFELEVEPDIWGGDFFWYYGERVVAWMPFPEPYKGDVTDSQDESTPVNLSDLYQCDPDKNTECTKTGCHINGGECWLTAKKECRKVE